jgi:regulator of Ty1 transposition protein 103
VTPSAPVHAARLNGLLKTLANAEGAVAEVIKARKLLIENLEKLLDGNRASLITDEAQFAELSSRRITIDKQKKDVEDSIMRGFATASNPSTPAMDGTPGQSHSPTTPAPEPDRPEVEALTPPTQSPRSPSPETYHRSSTNRNQELSTREPEYAPPAAAAGSDLLASLSGSGSYNLPQVSNGSVKKRKLNDVGDFPDLGGDAMDGIDDDVAEMLRGAGSAT